MFTDGELIKLEKLINNEILEVERIGTVHNLIVNDELKRLDKMLGKVRKL